MCLFHKWIVKEKETHPSVLDNIESLEDFRYRGTKSLNYRPVIVTYECSKCGRNKVERV
jgi:hypothetical protein